MTTAPTAPIDYRRAAFQVSAPDLKRCPADTGAEVAFAGRSNAGKSSAINTLTGQKKLARTSKTPGRTQLINFFSLEGDRRLVDLPGYGFAKVPPKMKLAWQAAMENYLSRRQSLKGLVLLMDIRHPLQPFDTMIINWALASEMPVHTLLTKADKLKRGAAKSTLLKVEKDLAPHADLISVQLFSALKQTGLDTLREQLDHWLNDTAGDEPGETAPGNPQPAS